MLIAESCKNTKLTRRQLNDLKHFRNHLIEFSLLLIKINQYTQSSDENGEGEHEPENNIRLLLKNKPKFSRATLDVNSYLLIECNEKDLPQSKSHVYIHERIFNLILSFMILSIKLDNVKKESNNNDHGVDMEEYSEGAELDDDEEPIELETSTRANYLSLIYEIFVKNRFLNCEDGLDEAVNDLNKDKVLKLKIDMNLVETCESLSAESIRNENMICFEIVNTILDCVPTKADLLDIMLNRYLLYRVFFKKKRTINGNLLFNLRFGLSMVSVYLIIKKLESDSTERELEQMVANSNKKPSSLLKMIENCANTFKALSSKHSLQVGSIITRHLTKRLSKNESITSSNMQQTDLFSFEVGESSKSKPVKGTSSHHLKQINTLNILENIQKQIDSLKQQQQVTIVNIKENEDEAMICDDEMSTADEEKRSLISVIETSTNQNLEFVLNQRLNQVGSNEIIGLLAETIWKYEFELDRGSDLSTVERSRSKKKQKRCVINILLDYFCHFDPQIMNRDFEIEYKLLFELKAFATSDMKLKLNSITHSFLLSLFIHQASWSRLFNCVQFLLANHTFFSIQNDKYR